MSLQEQRRSGADDDSPASPKSCPACGSRYPLDALFCPTDGTPLQLAAAASGPDVDPYLGKEILGHIEIRQLAGIGAMGRVYRAFQKGIDRDVAVKILHRELSANQQLVARFHREAKVASRLQHANVVHAYLTGQLPDGSMYIVMEYLDGLSLQSALAAVGGAFPLSRALRIALQLCEASGEAHAQGVIHRDIKPENVMLVRRADDEDFVKVLDFGIARLNWGDHQSMATAAGLIFGTARYISPEGAQGEQVGPTGDVYSIATLIYQMLSGRTPFEGESAVALLVQQIHDPPPPLRSVPRAAYVPEPIAQVIMRNLAKSPADRAPDARALGRALVDAVKASGLSPEDLIARGTLLGARPSAPLQISSMQRTRQMTLDAQTQERLATGSGAAPGTPGSPPSRTSHQPSGPVSRVPPGAPTTKWVPPPGFEARLANAAAGAFPAPRGPSVDPTLDDDDAAVTPPPPAAPLPVTRTAIRSHSTTPAPVSAPSPYSRKPASGVDSTLGEKVTLPGVPSGRGRAAVIVLLCFLLGVVGAGAICFKLGLIGGASRASLESEVSRATDALMHQRWDAPPGNNVVDITNEGLAAYPNDPQLLKVRAVACDEVMKIAKEEHHGGDAGDSLRLVKLAHELDPTDDDANKHLAEYQADFDKASSLAPAPEPSATPPGKLGATVDLAPAAARVGQSVSLVAHVTAPAPRGRIDGAEFAITAPGFAAAHVPALLQPSGILDASYAFKRAGKYTVTFSARVGGSPVASSRTIDVAGANAPLPLAPPTASAAASAGPPTTATVPSAAPAASENPSPSATSSSKWL